MVFCLIFISAAERVQLCYNNRNVVCVAHVVLVVNNLIRAHYNIIMKTTVAFGGKLPLRWSPDFPLGVTVWCDHCDELTPLSATFCMLL